MSDDFGAGFVYLFWLIAVAIFVLGVIEPVVLHGILRRTTNRKIQLVILGLALIPGYLLVNSVVMYYGGAMTILWSLLFIVPVAILTPPFVYPDLIDHGSRFKRIVSAYIVVIIFGIILLFGFMRSGSGIVFHSVFNSPTHIFTTAIYAGLVILLTLFAFAVYKILQELRPSQQVQNEKPE